MIKRWLPRGEERRGEVAKLTVTESIGDSGGGLDTHLQRTVRRCSHGDGAQAARTRDLRRSKGAEKGGGNAHAGGDWRRHPI
jgi:hypothetical protein